jgi:ADP-ribose pyrophosphatase
MWKAVSSKPCYSSPYFRVFEEKVILPNGEQILFSKLDMRDFVTVLPIASKKIVMIRNYRYPANRWFLELPSGNIERGETPKQCAERELLEETGYRATFYYRAWYHPVDRSLQKAHIFFAKALSKEHPDRDKTETQQVVTIPAQEAMKKLDQGKLRHAPTIVALSLCRNLILSPTG